MYPYEITSRLGNFRLYDCSGNGVAGASYDDLNPTEREKIRNIIQTNRGDTALLELTDEEFDKALRFVVSVDGEPVPTLAGMLLMGRENRIKELIPTAEWSIQVLSGTEVRLNFNSFAPLLTAVDKFLEVFNAYNQEFEFEMGLFRIPIPDYDTSAFREALINAISHRDYTRMGRVLLQMRDDGMIISNPGGFIEGISLDNLLDAEPYGRNSVLTDVLKRIGLAERTGRGIDRIYEGSLRYGRFLPDYSKSSSVSVHLFIPKGLYDEAFVKFIAEEQQKSGQPLPIQQMMVLNALRLLQRGTLQDIVEELRGNESRIRATITQLVSCGLVEMMGSARNKTYMLPKSYFSQDSASYVRHKDIDSLRYEELVLELAQTKGKVTRKDVTELLRITNNQAYRLLTKMKERGKLKQEEEKRGPFYVAVLD